MTREEAIEILKTDSCVDCGVGSQSPCTCTFDGYCDIKDALEMAIKALEQEPCDDAISRQAVLDILSHHAHNFNADIEIKNLPPVTPTRNKGKWVNIHDKEEWYGDQFRCSLCGKVTIDNGLYCPNCGAKMESEQLLSYADQDTMMPAT